MPLKLRMPGRDALRNVVLALLGAAIVHIVVTLVAPHLNTSNAFARVAARFPVNQAVLLPPVTSGNQLLPYQMPDFRYVVCVYDASRGPVQMRADLSNPGWMLTVTSSSGDSAYSVIGQERGRPEVNLLLVPPGERFVGLVGDATGAGTVSVPLPTARGMVVVRAPNDGAAYAAQNELKLRRAGCRLTSP